MNLDNVDLWVLIIKLKFICYFLGIYVFLSKLKFEIFKGKGRIIKLEGMFYKNVMFLNFVNYCYY